MNATSRCGTDGRERAEASPEFAYGGCSRRGVRTTPKLHQNYTKTTLLTVMSVLFVTTFICIAAPSRAKLFSLCEGEKK